MQDHNTPFEVDRQWTALESNDALRKILRRIYDAENNIGGDAQSMYEKHKPAVAAAAATAVAQTINPKFEVLESGFGKVRNVITIKVTEPLRKVE